MTREASRREGRGQTVRLATERQFWFVAAALLSFAGATGYLRGGALVPAAAFVFAGVLAPLGQSCSLRLSLAAVSTGAVLAALLTVVATTV